MTTSTTEKISSLRKETPLPEKAFPLPVKMEALPKKIEPLQNPHP
jgi:hypothetical protein